MIFIVVSAIGFRIRVRVDAINAIMVNTLTNEVTLNIGGIEITIQETIEELDTKLAFVIGNIQEDGIVVKEKPPAPDSTQAKGGT